MATVKAIRGLVKSIRSELGLKKTSKLGMMEALKACCRRAGQELPHDVYHGAYGIAWALETGRLSGAVDIAVRGMSAYEVVALVGTLALTVHTIGEVPGWLNANADVIVIKNS